MGGRHLGYSVLRPENQNSQGERHPRREELQCNQDASLLYTSILPNDHPNPGLLFADTLFSDPVCARPRGRWPIATHVATRDTSPPRNTGHPRDR
jgi:hypothetical protein